MPNALAQGLSLAGAILVLVAYAGSQGAVLRTDGLAYGLLNLVGSVLLAITAVVPLNLGVLVLESAWALISLRLVVRAAGRRAEGMPGSGET